MCVFMCEVRGCPGQVRVQRRAYNAWKCRLTYCRFDTGSDIIVGEWRRRSTKVPKTEMSDDGARWKFSISHVLRNKVRDGNFPSRTPYPVRGGKLPSRTGASWKIPISHLVPEHVRTGNFPSRTAVPISRFRHAHPSPPQPAHQTPWLLCSLFPHGPIHYTILDTHCI